MKYDVVVIGGGPSGAALGTLLARGGRSVLIVDQAHFPRRKPCAGLISARCAKAVGQVFGGDCLRKASRATSTACSVFDGGRLLAEVDGCEEMFFVERSELDALFLSAAKSAGCCVLEETSVVGVQPNESAVRLASGETVHGSIIAGADGANSVVRRALLGPRIARFRARGFGLLADVPLERLKGAGRPDVSRDCPQIHFGLVPLGYGWVFPKGDHVCIGVGGLIGEQVNFRKLFNALVESNCVGGTLQTLKIAGHPIPFGSYEKRPGRGNVLLLGDAAGLVEPVTGEGVVFALESALIAADAIAESLDRGRPETAGRRYNRAYRRKLLPGLRRASWAGRLFFSRWGMPRALRALGRHPELVRWYFEIIAGTLTYPAYFRRMFRRPWRRKGGDS